MIQRLLQTKPKLANLIIFIQKYKKKWISSQFWQYSSHRDMGKSFRFSDFLISIKMLTYICIMYLPNFLNFFFINLIGSPTYWHWKLELKFWKNFTRILLVRFFPKERSLTLLAPGQGHNGPGNWNKVCHIHNIRAGSIKILDFVPFYVWMVLENSFLEFVFEIFCKTEKEFFDRSVPSLEEKIEDIKKYFLFT